MKKKFNFKRGALLLYIFFIPALLLSGTNPNVTERKDWAHQDFNVTASDDPSNLKYFRYYDILPDEIILPMFNKLDLSQYAGKKLFVGYGVADPTGKDCRIFPSSQTGLGEPITVCLPWWRIERVYQKERKPAIDLHNALCAMPKPRPPIMVHVCREYETAPILSYDGGKHTCISYYSRLRGGGCWDNPNKAECFVDNCSEYVKKNCNHVMSVMGEKYNFETPVHKNSKAEFIATKMKVVTYQYQCPSGASTIEPKCTDRKHVLMFPYECKPDDPNTLKDDGVYLYCDEKQPVYEGTEITGFLGTCPSGTPNAGPIVCDVDSFTETKQRCVAPIYQSESFEEPAENVYIKSYTEHEIDVLSGEDDKYAADPNCLRINTVEDSRDKEVFARIKTEGALDDDFYIFKHSPYSGSDMFYCNLQHHGSDVIAGKSFSCERNTGSYSVDKKLPIVPGDVVSIQQASDIGASSVYLNVYASGCTTNVYIDGVLSTPAFEDWNIDPYAPGHPGCYNAPRGFSVIDRGLMNFTLMFPYAGAYTLYFFGKDNNLLFKQDLTIDDFKDIGHGFKRFYLGDKIPIADYAQSQMNTDGNLTDCRKDSFGIVGGGVLHGVHSNDNTIRCPSHPSIAWLQSSNQVIHKILVKDYISDLVTNVDLVYPMIYPNRIFISKLKLYETRKYRCYDPFPANLK